jgi:hypothetical protein
MRKPKLFHRKPRTITPENAKDLIPSPWANESKAIFLMIGTMLFFVVGMGWILPAYYVHELYYIGGGGGWLIICMGIWGLSFGLIMSEMQKRVETKTLLDRKFFYNEYFYPIEEIFIDPEKQMTAEWTPETKLENQGDLVDRLGKMSFQPAQINAMKGLLGIPTKGTEENTNEQPKVEATLSLKNNMWLYYIAHKNKVCTGVDIKNGEVHKFTSHMVVQEGSFGERQPLTRGQENWTPDSGIPFNHGHCVQDIVEPIFWAKDPNTNEPMPICRLVWSPKSIKQNGVEKKDDVDITKALALFISKQHSIIDSERKEKTHYKDLLHSKISDYGEQLKIGEDVADVYVDLYEKTKRPIKRRFWQRGWVQALVTCFIVGALIFFGIYILQWLGVKVF